MIFLKLKRFNQMVYIELGTKILNKEISLLYQRKFNPDIFQNHYLIMKTGNSTEIITLHKEKRLKQLYMHIGLKTLFLCFFCLL